MFTINTLSHPLHIVFFMHISPFSLFLPSVEDVLYHEGRLDLTVSVCVCVWFFWGWGGTGLPLCVCELACHLLCKPLSSLVVICWFPVFCSPLLSCSLTRCRSPCTVSVFSLKSVLMKQYFSFLLDAIFRKSTHAEQIARKRTFTHSTLHVFAHLKNQQQLRCNDLDGRKPGGTYVFHVMHFH